MMMVIVMTMVAVQARSVMLHNDDECSIVTSGGDRECDVCGDRDYVEGDLLAMAVMVMEKST